MKNNSKQKPLLQNGEKNIWGIIIISIIFILIALFLYKIEYPKKEYKEQIKYFTGELYSANHAANLIDNIEHSENVAFSPINYNASLGILYNITDNNSEKQLKTYFKKDVSTINEEIHNQLNRLQIELISKEYNKLNNKTIETMSDKEKEELYLLTNKLNLAYEALIGKNPHTEKTLKKYTIKEKDITHNTYTIYLLLEKVLDQYETYNINNQIININNLYYKENIINTKKLNETYLNKIHKYYTFELHKYNSTNESLNDLNKYFNEKTNNKIIRVLEENDLNNDFIYINSLYFNCTWDNNIKSNSVSDGIFNLIDGEEHIVEYMYDQVNTYMENDYARAFKKDFANSKYSFIGILPKQNGEFKLSNLDLDSLLKSSTNTEKILISIPKISYYTKIDTKKISENNKITEIFTTKANFSKLTDESMYISRMNQYLYINIAEKGTEGTTIKENSLSTFTIDESQKQILLNRPFAYLILDNETNNVIIIGKVIKP